MSDVVSQTEIRTRVRHYANMENSSFVTDAELNTRINASARRLYAKLVAARGQEYYRANATISAVAGTSVYAMPSDFWQLLLVMVQDNGVWLRMSPFEMNEVPQLANLQAPRPSNIRYRLSGRQKTAQLTDTDQIELMPTPTTAFPITVAYLPTLHLVHAGVTNEVYYNGVAGFEEWTALDVAIQCLAKEESDPSVLMQLKSEVERDIESLSGARDAGAGAHVVDVRGDLGRMNLWHLPPRWGGLP